LQRYENEVKWVFGEEEIEGWKIGKWKTENRKATMQDF